MAYLFVLWGILFLDYLKRRKPMPTPADPKKDRKPQSNDPDNKALPPDSKVLGADIENN